MARLLVKMTHSKGSVPESKNVVVACNKTANATVDCRNNDKAEHMGKLLGFGMI